MNIKTNGGFLILEIVMAATVLSLGGLVAIAIANYANQRLTANRLNSSYDRLTQTIVRLASTPAALRASANTPDDLEPYNRDFAICVNGDNQESCINKNGNGTYVPFRLHLASVSNTDKTNQGVYGIRTSGAISGTKQFPIRYDAFGSLCDSSKGSCPNNIYPISVYSEFLPICYNQWTSYFRGLGAAKPTEPLYPSAYAPLPRCYYARFLKVRVIFERSATDNHGKAISQMFETVVDSFIVKFARQ